MYTTDDRSQSVHSCRVDRRTQFMVFPFSSDCQEYNVVEIRLFIIQSPHRHSVTHRVSVFHTSFSLVKTRRDEANYEKKKKKIIRSRWMFLTLLCWRHFTIVCRESEQVDFLRIFFLQNVRVSWRRKSANSSVLSSRNWHSESPSFLVISICCPFHRMTNEKWSQRNCCSVTASIHRLVVSFSIEDVPRYINMWSFEAGRGVMTFSGYCITSIRYARWKRGSSS